MSSLHPEIPENPMPVHSFPLARYRFEFQATRPIRLPDYAGSMLRGAFGHALRKLACMTKQKDCAGCPLFRVAPTPRFARRRRPRMRCKILAIPVPYVIGHRNPVFGHWRRETFIQHRSSDGAQGATVAHPGLATGVARDRCGDGTELLSVVQCGVAGARSRCIAPTWAR